jgi:hypothetical protein
MSDITLNLKLTLTQTNSSSPSSVFFTISTFLSRKLLSSFPFLTPIIFFSSSSLKRHRSVIDVTAFVILLILFESTPGSLRTNSNGRNLLKSSLSSFYSSVLSSSAAPSPTVPILAILERSGSLTLIPPKNADDYLLNSLKRSAVCIGPLDHII